MSRKFAMAAGLCSLSLLAATAQAEGSKPPGAAAADWAKRAVGGSAQPEAAPDASQEDARDKDEGEPAEEAPEASPSSERAASERAAAPPPAAEEPSEKAGWKQRVISPIFSELVMFSMPVSFVVRFENTREGAYIREAVPKGETVEQWSEMITVTGTKDLADGDVTPLARFDQATQMFKRACPRTFASKEIETISVKDHETYAAVASCGTVPAQPKSHSETTAFLIIKGAHDYYSIQWAVRGPASSKPLDIDAQQWQSRLAKLQPVNVCLRKDGEKAPYPSCIGG